jgi:hypothetical protein
VPTYLDEIAPVWSGAPYPLGTAPNFEYTEPPVYEVGRLVRVPTTPTIGTFHMCIQTHRGDPSRSPTNPQFWVGVDRYNLAGTDAGTNPIFWPAVSKVLPPDTKFEDITGQVAAFTQRGPMRVVTLNGRVFFQFHNPEVGTLVNVPAADTDGDGMPDALYFKLPVGRVNGLDWYAAVRVVDNAAAVNAAVALEPGGIYKAGPPNEQLVPGRTFFPTSANLLGNLVIGTPPQVTQQFTNVYRSRLNDLPGDDVRGTTYAPDPKNSNPTINPPIDDRAYLPRNQRERNDFNFHLALDQMLWTQLGRRLRNPGYWYDGSPTIWRLKALPPSDAGALGYRGGTLLNPETLAPQWYSPTALPLHYGSSLTEQILHESLFAAADNHPINGSTGLNGAYRLDVSRRTSYPTDDPLAWQEEFRRNFDFSRFTDPVPPFRLPRFAPPAPAANDPSTYPNYRALITVNNAVSTALPSRLVPRGQNAPRPTMPGDWIQGARYDVGDYVLAPVPGGNGAKCVYVCISPVPFNTGLAPGLMLPANSNLPREHPRWVNAWEPRPFEFYATKASLNAASYGQLFLAYWQMMGEPTSAPEAVNAVPAEAPPIQSPTKDDFRAALAASNPGEVDDADSPYWGGRFVTLPYGAAVFSFLPYANTNASGVPDQNPLRMFRSTVRAVPRSNANANNLFGADTPRLPTDEVMRLRAALAAVNTIDMRDADDDVTFQDVNLAVTLNRGNNLLDETPSDDTAVVGRVRVYGHERQPFITEVFAHLDTQSTGPGGTNANASGYVAVELYNPYPFAINIRHCKLACIDRTPGNTRNLTVADATIPATASLAPLLQNAVSNLPGTVDTDPWVIPGNGVLVLENFNAGTHTPPAGSPPVPPGAVVVAPANYRPASTGLPAIGGVTAAANRNYAYVPNLHKVFDREMALVRPLFAQQLNSRIAGNDVVTLHYTERVGATVTTPAVDMAPLDSFDFTGMPNVDPLVIQDTGNHRGTATPRVPNNRAFAWHYARAYETVAGAGGINKSWRFVYPGRYDGHQTVNVTGERRPRQQGTQSIAWLPGGASGDPWDPTGPGAVLPNPPVTLSGLAAVGNWLDATYPHEYTIQLSTGLLVGDGAAGPNPVRALTGNAYPFGGFARAGDALQVPYIGSYRIKLTALRAPPGRVQNIPGMTPQFGARVTDAGYNQVLELNSITMDSVFAEDTDPQNYSAPTPAPATHPEEQIGRFTPTMLDLEVGAGGTVTAINPGPAGVVRGMNYCDVTVLNPEEIPGTGAWVGYEMVITAGPGRGQVRPVISFGTGTLRVFPDWDTPLVPFQSRYMLRRGSRWRDQRTTPPLVNRATGNKYWAADLFDYVAVETPQDDYFPPADPASYGRNVGGLPPEAVNNTDPDQPAAITYSRVDVGGAGGNRVQGLNNLMDRNGVYVGGFVQFVTGAARGEVRQVTGYAGNNRTLRLGGSFDNAPAPGDVFRVFGPKSEDLTGVQGLININTAPWPVLALVPWAIPDDYLPTLPFVQRRNQALGANRVIAQEICKYRDGDPSAGIARQGPFRTLFDLYKVPAFRQHHINIINLRGGTLEPNDEQGDWTPAGTGVDGVRNDYEEQYLLLNRVSNMLTTRSDSFTCYVLVQGMRDGGTPNASVVVQRRKAFVFDRSGVHEQSKDVPPQYFYNE